MRIGPFRKIERGRIADQILDDLRDRIVRGALPRGSKLPAERELAEQYGVSGATVREAVRALTAMGLIDVRHGSGSYVTANGDALMAVSIASVVQLERVSAADVLGILGVLNGHAAELAAAKASRQEIAGLRAAVERLAVISAVEQTAADLKDFLQRLSAISHNPLLAALCKFLADLQVEFALEASERKLSAWRKVAGALQQERLQIVEALEARDAQAAVALVRAYHQRALSLVAALPKAREFKLSDPHLSGLISSLAGGRVLMGAT
jgi:GntR family transcriptional repressor for pyruvate dehydrogenase complex